MVDVRPFRGLRYNPSGGGDLTRLISPPYDIISPAQQTDLYQRSPRNAVRLELAESRPEDSETNNRYTRAAATFQEWLREGVLVPEGSPAVYLTEEKYQIGGKSRVRGGFMVCVRLEEFGEGSVFPHEYTTPGPKKDRLSLMKACKANFSPLLTLFSDPDGSVQAILRRAKGERPPDISTEPIDDGMAYKMWVVTDDRALSEIRSAMASKAVYLADGHHRYETALEYRGYLKDSGMLTSPDHAANFVMMSLLPMEDPGLLVMPYHRLIGGLSEGEMASLWNRIEDLFGVEEQWLPSSSPMSIAEALAVRLKEIDKDRIAVAAYTSTPERGVVWLLKDQHMPKADAPALERCEPRFLSTGVLRPALGEAREGEAVSFVHDGEEAVGSVQNGEYQMALLLRPMPTDLFEEVVTRGDRLPPKSTYFYPKLPTGLVFNHLEGELSN